MADQHLESQGDDYGSLSHSSFNSLRGSIRDAKHMRPMATADIKNGILCYIHRTSSGKRLLDSFLDIFALTSFTQRQDLQISERCLQILHSHFEPTTLETTGANRVDTSLQDIVVFLSPLLEISNEIFSASYTLSKRADALGFIRRQRDKMDIVGRLLKCSKDVIDLAAEQEAEDGLDLLLSIPVLDQLILLSSSKEPHPLTLPIISHPLLLTISHNQWSKPELSSPRNLHRLALLWNVWFLFLVLYLAMFTEYKHEHHINPFVWYYETEEGESGRRKQTAPRAILWWAIYVPSVFGYFIGVLKAIYRGPLTTPFVRKLPPGSIVPLVGHTMLFISLILRLTHCLHISYTFIYASYVLLCASLPFLFCACLLLPSTIPSINPGVLTSGLKAFFTLSAFSSHLHGFTHSLWFLVIFSVALIWSLNGEIDIYDPDTSWDDLNVPGKGPHRGPPGTGSFGRVAPMEARTAIACGLFVGLLMAWIGGGEEMRLKRETEGWRIQVWAISEWLRTLNAFEFRETEMIIMPPLNWVWNIGVDLPSLFLKGEKRLHWRKEARHWIWTVLMVPQLWLIFGWKVVWKSVHGQRRIVL